MAAAAAAVSVVRHYSESGIRGRKTEVKTLERGRGKWKERAVEGLRGVAVQSVPLRYTAVS